MSAAEDPVSMDDDFRVYIQPRADGGWDVTAVEVWDASWRESAGRARHYPRELEERYGVISKAHRRTRNGAERTGRRILRRLRRAAAALDREATELR